MDEENDAVIALNKLAETLAPSIANVVYDSELKKAIKERIKKQKETADLINTVLEYKHFFQFVPQNLIKTISIIPRLYYLTRYHERLSSSMLKDYDSYSQRYFTIEERVKKLKDMLQGDMENNILTTIAPTLEKLVSTYNLTLYSLDNYRRMIREAWDIFYPKKSFPRE